jgi:hypothetical protein
MAACLRWLCLLVLIGMGLALPAAADNSARVPATAIDATRTSVVELPALDESR